MTKSNETRKRLSTLLDRLARLSADVAKERQQHKAQLAALRQENEALKKDREDARNEARVHAETLTMERQAWSSGEKDLKTQIKRLRDELALMSDSGGGALIAGIREDRDSLREQVSRLRSERDEMVAAYRVLQRRYRESLDNRQELVSELDGAIADYEKLVSMGG